MILLDTNIISELMKEQPDASVLAWVDDQVDTDLYFSTITKAEIEWGIGLLSNGKRKQQLHEAAAEIFDLFAGRCLDYSCNTASHYVDIALYSKYMGRPMSVEDMMIGAIAISNDCLLATRNITDFDFLPDLRLLNPWEQSCRL